MITRFSWYWNRRVRASPQWRQLHSWTKLHEIYHSMQWLKLNHFNMLDFPADSCLSIPHQVGRLKGNKAELSETKSIKSPAVHHVAWPWELALKCYHLVKGLPKKKHHLTPKTRWWFQPVWKILVKMEIFPKWGRWLPSISCPLACRLQLWPGIRCTGFCTGKLLRLVVRKSELQNPREVGGKPLSSKHESYIYI